MITKQLPYIVKEHFVRSRHFPPDFVRIFLKGFVTSCADISCVENTPFYSALCGEIENNVAHFVERRVCRQYQWQRTLYGEMCRWWFTSVHFKYPRDGELRFVFCRVDCCLRVFIRRITANITRLACIRPCRVDIRVGACVILPKPFRLILMNPPGTRCVFNLLVCL